MQPRPMAGMSTPVSPSFRVFMLSSWFGSSADAAPGAAPVTLPKDTD